MVPEKPPFPTAWSRTPPAVALRDVVQRLALRPVLHSGVDPRVEGLEALEGLTGPVVLVANHSSHLDTPLVLCSLPPAWRRRTVVAAAADYFFDTWWRATGSAVLFGTFPIERRSGRLSSTPGDLLEAGWSIVIYPEGTRSPDGWTRRFQLGAAYLAARAGVPVVPIAIRGAFAAMPKGRNWPVPGRTPVTVRFGAPVVPAPGEGPRELGPRVEQAVARLLDEDVTSWYSSARRTADAAAAGDGTARRAGSLLPAPPSATWRRVWEQTGPRVPARTGGDGRRRRRTWGR